MIKIGSEIIRNQPNFWNHALFHPTDAIEDPWGKRILDRIAADGAIKTMRIYSMFEDIVYIGENGELCYDWRLSDLRLDYLLEKGFDILLAYGGVPDCIAESIENQASVSKNKTRYKGKMWNTSPPKSEEIWEEVCYQYTKHNVERYGADVVAKWHCHCHNEPDGVFFFGHLPRENYQPRLEAYCKMYAAFARGVKRASKEIKVGGPATTSAISNLVFLDGFLDYVKKNDLPLDYIALHNYGTGPAKLNSGEKRIAVRNMLHKHVDMMNVVRKNGFENTRIIMDEWGAAAAGFYNREECPALMFREHEVFSSYFAKLIRQMIDLDPNVYRMLICLSGQHEMVEDFSGFRNFFTLNFIAKPIYNAYIMASKLHEGLLEAKAENENIFTVPTKNDKGDLAVLLTYSTECFEENLPEITETLSFSEDITGRTVTVWCIDKNTTNPYRLYQKMGVETPNEEQLKLLREEGQMKPKCEFVAGKGPVELTLTANCTYLVTVKGENDD